MCSSQLSLLPFAVREMSSSLRATTGWRPSVADWGQWYVCALHRGSNCSLARAMDGHIMRCGIISSYQSAATSETVKCSWACVHRGAALYQVPDLYLFCTFYLFNLLTCFRFVFFLALLEVRQGPQKWTFGKRGRRLHCKPYTIPVPQPQRQGTEVIGTSQKLMKHAQKI